MILVLFPILFGFVLYLYGIKPYGYWRSKNVPTGTTLPSFLENLPILLGLETGFDMIIRTYNKIPDARYFGIYQLQRPILMIRTPDLIKRVLVKDHDHFLDHKGFVPLGIDDTWSRNIFALKGQSWKTMRSTLSPTFTSSKMKVMFLSICETSKSFVQHFLGEKEKVIQVEFKDTFTRFTNDFITSACFGIKINSMVDRENDFYLMGLEIFQFYTFSKKLVFLLYQIAPKLAQIFKVNLFSNNMGEFFLNLVRNAMEMREKNNIKRSDMLGLLMEARRAQDQDSKFSKLQDSSYLSDENMASQMFVFYFGGFETTSTAMCFMAYELAVNPDIQERLMEEIDENRNGDDPPTYEAIMNMTYLDMVVTESLRKWPVNVWTDREVTKTYIIEPELPGEKEVRLEPGDNVMIPITPIHWDPKYYENPQIFNPERFSPENKHNVDPYTYVPFGLGPRNCIGIKLGLLAMKTMFFYLLSNFEIVPTEKTQIPLKISKESIMFVQSQDGFNLGLKKRNFK